MAGYTGVVLVGGPIGPVPPRTEALSAGAVLAAAGTAAAWRTPSERRLRFAAASLLGTAPFLAFAAVMYASPGLAHLTTQTSALGWVLLPTLLLVPAIAYRTAATGEAGVDVAFGGAIGVACAALLHVAVADDSFGWQWTVPGWICGAALMRGLMRLPPHPALRLQPGLGWRALPTAAAWIMAVIASFPAAPRHELATSAAAQTLAAVLAGGCLLTTLILWRSERLSIEYGLWRSFRQTMRRFAPAITVGALLLIGGLQAASYSAATIDDLGHFWYSADALSTHGEYPVWGDWMSLPGLPLLLIVAFTVFGHTYAAALAPMFLANLLLPWLLFRAALAVGATRAVAFAVAVLTTVLPPLQIDSLGSAEPDPIFIALLAAGVWAFAHVLRTRNPRQSLLLLGCIAAALALTRPEGLLYGGLTLLAALIATRSRWAVAASLGAGVLLSPLAVYSLLKTGRPWPTMSQEFTFANLVEHAGLVGGVTWPKIARVVLLNDLRFAVLIATILALFTLGSVHLARRRPAFAALPAAVVINIVVALGISATTVRPHEPHEFVRHIAYPAPIVAALAAVGISALAARAARRGAGIRMFSHAVGIGAAAYLTVGSLYVLATPEEFHHGNRSGSLFADNIYVNAPELWRHPMPLPCPPCLPSGEWNFSAFRHEFFAWYEPFDNHSGSSGAAYQTLTGGAAAAGFSALLVAAPPPQRSARDETNGELR